MCDNTYGFADFRRSSAERTAAASAQGRSQRSCAATASQVEECSGLAVPES